jgi:(p)ppGpp synthase/HD superfamily hydrolase
MHEAGVFDERVLAAAVLHDTVEDTDTSLDELRGLFGPEIAHIVSEVTDDKGLAKEERKKRQITHAREISEAGKLVKMADKLYNLRDLKDSPPVDWSLERCQIYFRWARMVVEGCRGINEYLDRELDQITNPESCQISFQGSLYPCFTAATPTYS